MTAIASTNPRHVPRQRRIIERPRLMKMLDETDARTILLLAPAGYGKTTLARQWAKTLNGAVWLTLTPAHRDVAVLALDLAHACDESLGGESERFVQSYLVAHASPTRVLRELSRALAKKIRSAGVRWLIFDDYHEVIGATDSESFVEELIRNVDARHLLATRISPSWASARLAIYGDVTEVRRTDLAMTVDEGSELLGKTAGAERMLQLAEGWPALLGLACRTDLSGLLGSAPPTPVLHEYFANELFMSVEPAVRAELMRLALAPDLEPETLREFFGDSFDGLIDRGAELGFLTCASDTPELHPLFRAFLLEKLKDEAAADQMVTETLAACLRHERWERAFELILKFNRMDLAEPVFQTAYLPLIRCGQLTTLSTFAGRLRKLAPSGPLVDLVDAEIALADGDFDLAATLAVTAIARLGPDHPLTSRAHLISAQHAYFSGEFDAVAETARAAYESAQTENDRADALRGWALVTLQSETPLPTWVIAEVESRRYLSALDLARFTSIELVRLHFTEGFRTAPALIAQAERVLDDVSDPRARSSLLHAGMFVKILALDVHGAARLRDLAEADIEAFDLDFARPHALWNSAFLALTARRFGDAERHLQKLEDGIAKQPVGYHVVNARLLRGRLALETGQPETALAMLPTPIREAAIPSLRGEYLATRGLAFASLGNREEAVRSADEAAAMTTAIEVRVMTAAIRAACTLSTDTARAVLELWELAEGAAVWEPLIAAARGCPQLALRLSGTEGLRRDLAALYQRSNDVGLARQAGLRVRATRSPREILSPREIEVLGLVARGFHNSDIAEALVVSQSTVKVHVRHILEKLGVRTRAEAVARYAQFD